MFDSDCFPITSQRKQRAPSNRTKGILQAHCWKVGRAASGSAQNSLGWWLLAELLGPLLLPKCGGSLACFHMSGLTAQKPTPHCYKNHFYAMPTAVLPFADSQPAQLELSALFFKRETRQRQKSYTCHTLCIYTCWFSLLQRFKCSSSSHSRGPFWRWNHGPGTVSPSSKYFVLRECSEIKENMSLANLSRAGAVLGTVTFVLSDINFCFKIPHQMFWCTELNP